MPSCANHGDASVAVDCDFATDIPSDSELSDVSGSSALMGKRLSERSDASASSSRRSSREAAARAGFTGEVPATPEADYLRRTAGKSVQPPPGVFVQPPPGLSLPYHAVIGLVTMEDVLRARRATPQTPRKSLSVAQKASEDDARSTNTFVWFADARRLTSSERVMVSPRFEIKNLQGSEVPFRLLLHAAEEDSQTGRLSFKKTKGLAHIQVKSEVPTPLSLKVTVDVSYHTASCVHNFADAITCKMPGSIDLTQAVDAVMETVKLAVTITG